MFVKRDPNTSDRCPNNLGTDSLGVIHVIHNPLCSSILPNSYRLEVWKIVHLRWSYAISDSAHLIPAWPSYEGSQDRSISFSNSDLRDVQLPHNDPLVVTLRIGNFDVRRVLIDQGSFAEVMYYDLYKKLGLGEADLASFVSPVFGFSGELIIPWGKKILPVLEGLINLQTEFLVVQASSPYNAIMGRGWLHKMRAVPSTLHQKLRFPIVEGIMEINGDQVTAKQCVLATVRCKKPTTREHKEILWQPQKFSPEEEEVGLENAPEKVFFDTSNPELCFSIGSVDTGRRFILPNLDPHLESLLFGMCIMCVCV